MDSWTDMFSVIVVHYRSRQKWISGTQFVSALVRLVMDGVVFARASY